MNEVKKESGENETGVVSSSLETRMPWIEPSLSTGQDALELTMASGSTTSTTP